MTAKVIDWQDKVVGKLDLPEWLVSSGVRYDIMHRVLRWQHARSHTGTRAVKGRAVVAATKKKPFRQKGTGRARQGTTVAPHMRGGGVCFGPSPEQKREFSLPKRVRRMGLRSSLALRLKEDALFVLKASDFSSDKTKDFVACMKSNGWESILFVSAEKRAEKLLRACANTKGFDVLPVMGLNVQDVLKHKRIFVLEDAYDAVIEKVRL